MVQRYTCLNEDSAENDWSSAEYLRVSFFRSSVLSVTYFVSFGLMYLLAEWVTAIHLFKFERCPSESATHILVRGTDKSLTVTELHHKLIDNLTIDQSISKDMKIEVTHTYKQKNYWKKANSPSAFRELSYKLDLNSLNRAGLSHKEFQSKQDLFGECLIEVPVPPTLVLLYREIIHPFFIFQVFSIVLWLLDQYYLYSFTIIILTLISLTSTLIETRNNLTNIKELAHYECQMKVLREGKWTVLTSRQLVPGDIVKVKQQTLPCDCFLLEGSALIDESILTGESQPVLKERNQHFLYAGTTPLAINSQPVAIVTAIGFDTAKGKMVRSIMFPKPSKFNFYSDSFKFVGFMGLITLIGFSWCIPSFIAESQSYWDIIKNSLELVTIAVPPDLPLAMAVGVSFAIARLKSKQVSCIAPKIINSAGRVNSVIFDKTGTLTVDSMELAGAWDIEIGMNEDLEKFKPEFLENMLACQSLTMHRELLGDPMEIAVFKRLGARILEDQGIKYKESKIYKEKLFGFSSELKRMGSIISGDSLRFHVKGAPEVVLPMCLNIDHQVVDNFNYFTTKGYRVLACAYKDIEYVDENNLEDSLNFLGFILLVNPVKRETLPTLRELQNSYVNIYMSTGDALLTAVSVGKKIGIIDGSVLVGDFENEVTWKDALGNKVEFDDDCDSYAISGRLFEELLEDPLLESLIGRTFVFARMSPSQKTQLVEYLQSFGTSVMMVGDGANDCGALKSADVGVSISDKESSIAAPFTAVGLSKVVEVLKEGRASLVTSFQIFKFICMYSMVQFGSISFLFYIHNNFLDIQFLYQDLFLILPLAIFMAYTGASEILSECLPPGALISVRILSSILGQLFIQMFGLLASYFVLCSQDFFESQSPGVDHAVPTYENSVLFLVSCFQIIFVGICFSVGPPFRKSALTNCWFTLTVLLLVLFQIYILIIPDVHTREFLGVVDIEFHFRFVLVGIIVGVFIVTWAYEKFGVRLISYLLRR